MSDKILEVLDNFSIFIAQVKKEKYF